MQVKRCGERLKRGVVPRLPPNDDHQPVLLLLSSLHSSAGSPFDNVHQTGDCVYEIYAIENDYALSKAYVPLTLARVHVRRVAQAAPL